MRPQSRAACLVLVLQFVLFLAGCPRPHGSSSAADPLQPPAPPGLSIHVFSIGQADSMLVLGPPPARRSLLVDLGDGRSGEQPAHEQVADRIEELSGRRGVDWFMASHFHGDHVGWLGRGKSGTPRGMFALLDDPQESFTVGTWLDRGDGEQAWAERTRCHQQVLQRMPSWLESGRVGSRKVPAFGSGEIDLGGGVSVEILAVAGRVHASDPGALAAVEAQAPGTYAEAPASENDFSIALELSLGDFEFFTAGDLNGALQPGKDGAYPPSTRRSFGSKASTYTNVESWMTAWWERSGRESDVEIYRANHHGSPNSSTSDLLEALDPEFILYSCGGRYGHPAPEVVERGAATAVQYVTHSASARSWPEGLPEAWCQVAGEIVIEVSRDGSRYTIEDRRERSYSERQEASQRDARPR